MPEKRSVSDRKVHRWVVGVAAAYGIVAGLTLALDWHTEVDDFDWQDVVYPLVPLALFAGVGIWAVVLLGRGEWRQSVLYGAISVAVVILTAGEIFTTIESAHCECSVPIRRGRAEAVWIAFDTIPILKLNETLAWSEPQPLSSVTDVARGPAQQGAPDAPIGRWAPTLLVRFAVGFVLLALTKGLFEVFRRPQRSPHHTRRVAIEPPSEPSAE